MDGIIKSLKEYIKEKRRINKKIREDQKKYKKKLKEQEKIDKEIDKEIKKQEKEKRLEKKATKWYERLYNNVTYYYKDFTDNQDEKELYEAMTESQKKEYDEDKKFVKRFSIIVLIVLVAGISVALGGVYIFRINTMTEFESTIKPMIEEYYATNYDSKNKIKDIEYLTYVNENKEKIKTDIVLAKCPNGVNIMTIGTTLLGDDRSNGDKYEAYKEFIRNNLTGVNIYYSEPQLTFDPYVIEYNMYTDYIDVLPKDKTFEEMKNNHELTVIDRISYEGNLNLGIVQNILNNFGDNSVYYLFQMDGDRLLKFSIVSKNSIKEYDITQSTKIGEDVTYFQLDLNKNKISGVSITNISDLISDDYKYQYTYNKRITPNKAKGSYREQEEKTLYYLVRLDSSPLNGNYVYLDPSKYEELETDKYPESIYFRTSSGLFVLGEKEVAIGNKQDYEAPWYCRLGVC